MKFKSRGSAKNLSLDTSTWPPKVKNLDKAEESRPRTATLEKPVVLDASLFGHIDMTTMTRKGFLDACRVPPGAASPLFSAQNKAVIGILGLGVVTPTNTPTPKLRRNTPTTSEKVKPLPKHKKPVIEEEENGSLVSEETSSEKFGTFRIRRNNKLNRTFRVPVLQSSKALSEDIETATDPSLRNRTIVLDRKRRLVGGHRTALEEVLSGPVLKEHVPEPCRTCGRPELPERFHSHPRQPQPLPAKASGHHGIGRLPEETPLQKVKETPSEVTTKSSVRKPVPIKFRARRSSDSDPASVARNRSPSKVVQIPAGPQFIDPPSSPGKARFRTVVCYICGREFGTTSLPLHETHCQQKWLFQNSKLPRHWQRELPKKPDGPITVEDWNKFAWESSKGINSLQCPNCLRRFSPDRIDSHERICFKKHPSIAAGPDMSSESADLARGSPLVECYLCGKKFGSKSIAIHEPQCLKKWISQNADRTPPTNPRAPASGSVPGAGANVEQRGQKLACIEAPPPKKALAVGPEAAPNPASPKRGGFRSPWAAEIASSKEEYQSRNTPAPAESVRKVPDPTPETRKTTTSRTTPLGPRRRTLCCYLCGQPFSIHSLPIHEPQCLQKWQRENDKLPPHSRRPEPIKPDYIFKENGELDYWATFDRIWANHTESLVPCRTCGRSFFPDRIQIHERSCINNPHKN